MSVCAHCATVFNTLRMVNPAVPKAVHQRQPQGRLVGSGGLRREWQQGAPQNMPGAPV